MESISLSSSPFLSPSSPLSSTKVVFFQGIFASQSQAARYLGGDPILPSSFPGNNALLVHNPACGVSLPKCGALIAPHELYLGDEHPEIVYAYGWNPYYWTQTCTSWLLYQLRGFRGHQGYAVYVSQINLAQAGDVEQHIQRYESCRDRFPTSPVILWGASRGAATTFVSMALDAQNREKQRQFENVR